MYTHAFVSRSFGDLVGRQTRPSHSVNALTDILISDPAVKQILLQLEETGKEQFIIQELDDTHVLIKADAVERIRRELEIELEKNNYVSLDT